MGLLGSLWRLQPRGHSLARGRVPGPASVTVPGEIEPAEETWTRTRGGQWRPGRPGPALREPESPGSLRCRPENGARSWPGGGQEGRGGAVPHVPGPHAPRQQGPPAALHATEPNAHLWKQPRGRHRAERSSLETGSRTPPEVRLCQHSGFPAGGPYKAPQRRAVRAQTRSPARSSKQLGTTRRDFSRGQTRSHCHEGD